MCSGKNFQDEDVILANRLKCYDFRILHRLLFQLMQKDYDEELMELFWTAETLIDVEDDIRQYKEDVEKNVYNTYRMFVKLHKEAGKERLLDHLHSIDKKFREQLVQASQEYQVFFAELEKDYRKEAPAPEIPEPIL